MLWTKLAIFTNLRLQLQNSFFLNFNYCFLFLQIIFFDVILCSIEAIVPHIWAHIIKTVFSKLEFLFSVLGSMVFKNICKLRHKLKNSKNLPELTWSWPNKPWFIKIFNSKIFFLMYYFICYMNLIKQIKKISIDKYI